MPDAGRSKRGARDPRRIRASRAAVAGVIALSLVAACTGGPPAAGPDAGTVPIKPDVAVTATDDGISVTVPAGATDAEALSVAAVGVPVVDLPDFLRPVGSAAQVELAGGSLRKPATVRFPIPSDVDHSTGRPVVLWENGDGSWRWLPTDWTPGAAVVTGTTDHFSLGYLAWIDAGALRQVIEQELTSVIAARANVAQPSCGDESAARADGVKVTSDLGDSIKWCFGVQDGKRLLKIANNRRTYTQISFPEGWVVPEGATRGPALDPGQLDLLLGKTLGVAGRKGMDLRVIDAGDTLTLEVPAGSAGEAIAELSFPAWGLSAIRYGVETYAMLLSGTHPEASKLNNWDDVLRALGESNAAGELIVAAGRCAEGFDAVAAAPPPGVSRELVLAAWDCVALLLKSNPTVAGSRAFGWSKIVETAVDVLSVALGGGALLTTIVRQIADNVISLGGKVDDYMYNVRISRPAAPAFGRDTAIGIHGAGVVKAGMTIREAEKATGRKWVISHFETFEGLCYVATPQGLEQTFSAQIDNEVAPADPRDGVIGRISSYDDMTAPARTVSGIRIGDSLDKVRQAYGDTMSTEPHQYAWGGPGIYVTVDLPGEPDHRLRLALADGRTVDEIHGGFRHVVDLAEGCA